MEWSKDFQDPDIHHRQLSHLFGLFPGHTITPEKTLISAKPQLTPSTRGADGPGWSTTWKAALQPRLYDHENAYGMIKPLFNLVDPDHEALALSMTYTCFLLSLGISGLMAVSKG
ncbi:hypothetical protein Droror1_Dr00019299 [Drosera rotundifolia]